MQHKHTPAPWSVVCDNLAFDTMTTVLAGEYKEGIWTKNKMAVQVGGFAGVEESEANARLIAAAPELLKALYMMIAGEDGAIDAAKKAIYSATGDES